MYNNYLEDPEILSPVLLNAIDYLLLKSKDIIFGGSLALNAVGIIKRPIKDLDIVIDHDLVHYGLDKLPHQELGSDQPPTDVFDKKVTRHALMLNEIKVDVFQTTEVGFSKFKFSGREIRLNNVNEIIIAKKQYMINPNIKKESYDKHFEDVKKYIDFFLRMY